MASLTWINCARGPRPARSFPQHRPGDRDECVRRDQFHFAAVDPDDVRQLIRCIEYVVEHIA